MANLDLGLFITKSNIYIDDCRKVRAASQLDDLQKLPPERLADLKVALQDLRDVADWFDHNIQGSPSWGEVRDNAKKANTALESQKYADAMTSIKKIFDETTNKGVINVGESGTIAPGTPPMSSTPTVPAAGDTKKPLALHEFFSNVSNSVLEAQKALNRTSLEYVAALDPRIPPAYYGIPTVHAEMKVGFTETTDRRINLILFSSEQERRAYGESTVSFDVVGAPPPPGPAVYGDYLVPVPKFIVTGERRGQLLDALLAAGKVTGESFVSGAAYAAVLRYDPQPEEDPQRNWTYYLVIWPGRGLTLKPTTWQRWAIVNVAVDESADDPLPNRLKYLDPPKSVFEGPLPPGGVLSITSQNSVTKDSLAKPITDKVKVARDLVSSIVNTAPANKNTITKSLDDASTEAGNLAALLVNLCDVLMRTNLVAHDWLESVRHTPAPPPPVVMSPPHG
jgi:hypothetical protein